MNISFIFWCKEGPVSEIHTSYNLSIYLSWQCGPFGILSGRNHIRLYTTRNTWNLHSWKSQTQVHSLFDLIAFCLRQRHTTWPRVDEIDQIIGFLPSSSFIRTFLPPTANPCLASIRVLCSYKHFLCSYIDEVCLFLCPDLSAILSNDCPWFCPLSKQRNLSLESQKQKFVQFLKWKT